MGPQELSDLVVLEGGNSEFSVPSEIVGVSVAYLLSNFVGGGVVSPISIINTGETEWMEKDTEKQSSLITLIGDAILSKNQPARQ